MSNISLGQTSVDLESADLVVTTLNSEEMTVPTGEVWLATASSSDTTAWQGGNSNEVSITDRWHVLNEGTTVDAPNWSDLAVVKL